MGLKLPGPCPIEVFQLGKLWKARELATPQRQVHKRLGELANVDLQKARVGQSFERQLEPWQVWGTPPGEQQERILQPEEICDLGNGQTGWRQPEDYTHIIHAPTIPPGARVPPAACGAKVKAECFISTKANVEPTCPDCREVWRKEYQNR
jgi:hypothetical protein